MNTTPIALPSMGFYRDTDDRASHLANSWTSLALCGAAPTMRTIGWTIGATSGLNVAAVCPTCQDAYRQFAETIAAINADRR
jgi:hypothetical protein